VRRGIGYFVLMFVVGAIAGSAIGELLGHFAPNGPLHSILTRGTTIGIPHFSVDLLAFALSFGLTLRGAPSRARPHPPISRRSSTLVWPSSGRALEPSAATSLRSFASGRAWSRSIRRQGDIICARSTFSSGLLLPRR